MSITPSHIRLWRLARHEPIERDALVQLLGEAAAWSLTDRLPIFSLVGNLLECGDSVIRAAAVRVLAGATGPLVWRWIVARLNDESEAVRREAVTALAISSAGQPDQPQTCDPARMAHAVFHSDASVRRAVVELPFHFADETRWCGFLLADPDCREDAARRLVDLQLTDSIAQQVIWLHGAGRLPDREYVSLMASYFQRTCGLSEALIDGLLFAWDQSLLCHDDLLSAGWITRLDSDVGDTKLARHDEAAVWLYRLLLDMPEQDQVVKELQRRIVLAFGPRTLSRLLMEAATHTKRNVDHVLQTARSQRGLEVLHRAPLPDELDDVLDLVWPSFADNPSNIAQCELAESASEAMFEHLELTAEEGSRFAAAVLWAAHRHRWWHRPATLVAVRHYPELLAVPVLPNDVREFLIRRLAVDSGFRPEFTRSRLTALLLPVAMPDRRSGVDLLAVAALLSFLKGDRFSKAIGKLKIDRLVAAVEQDVERAVPLFCLQDDDSYEARNIILEQLRKNGTDASPTTSGIFSPAVSQMFPASTFERLLARMCFRLEVSELEMIRQLDGVTVTRVFLEMVSLLVDDERVPGFVLATCLSMGRRLGDVAKSNSLELCLGSLLLGENSAATELETSFLSGVVQTAPAKMLTEAIVSVDASRRRRLIDRLFSMPGLHGDRTWSWDQLPVATRIQLLKDLSRRDRPVQQAAEAVRPLAPASSGTETIAEPVTQEQIAKSVDVGWLVHCCSSSNLEVAENAAFRLLEVSTHGPPALARLLLQSTQLPHIEALAWTVPLWPQSLVEHIADHFLNDDNTGVRIRFIVGLGLTEFGLSDIFPKLLDLVCQPGESQWFTEELWDRLLQAAPSTGDTAFRLISSHQMVAVVRAAQVLVASDTTDTAVESLLMQAIERCPENIPFEIADVLAFRGFDEPLLLLVHAALRGTSSRASMDETGDALIGHMVVDSVLVGGNSVVSEQVALDHIGVAKTSSWVPDALQRLLLESSDDTVRSEAARRLQLLNARGINLGRITNVFAWGSQTARNLTGQRIRIRMLSDDQLGLMRHGLPEIFVSPLPILERARHGDDVVKGLIVHELGHHMYHSGDDHQSFHAAAREENLSRLLNVVLDEHLERNLRALSSEYGDQLKKLNAYAYQHQPKSFPVEGLLSMLGPHAFDVLTHCEMLPARNSGCVLIVPGVVLREFEANGSSFSRFFRALLMGLGNRSNDPKVAQALELFGTNFRHSTAEELFLITRRLREIFGAETDMLDQLGAETMTPTGDSELAATAAGLSDEKIDAEIRRVVDGMPEQPAPSVLESLSGIAGGGRPRVVFNLNVTPKEQFNGITTVEQLSYDSDARRRYSAAVAPQARRLRLFLRDLGFGYDTQRMRTSGRRLDRGRLIPLVVSRDPRVLLSREVSFENDLFLSIVVDCSSSMYGGDIEKARSFATLLADACLGLPGVDVRLFGFTDSVIFDAGDARRCAAHALQTNGGNNDAAGLAHAADAAFHSKRRAKALVMISDGMPTDCSVDALRGLVRRLTYRYGIVCAQVATCNLSEVCFPDYVVLQNSDVGQAVTEFGTILRRLIQKALQ